MLRARRRLRPRPVLRQPPVARGASRGRRSRAASAALASAAAQPSSWLLGRRVAGEEASVTHSAGSVASVGIHRARGLVDPVFSVVLDSLYHCGRAWVDPVSLWALPSPPGGGQLSRGVKNLNEKST